MDGVLAYPGKGKRNPTDWLFETKTRGQVFDQNLSTTLHRDLQVNIYLLALTSRGIRPSGVIYNEVRRPALRLLAGRGKNPIPETLPEHEARVRAHAREDYSKYFRRLEVSVTPADIGRFDEEFHGMIAEFQRWYNDGMPGWRYGQPCVGKYGPCPYIGKCFEDSEIGLRRRERMFEELAY
jgi:hypothetical protein